MQAAEEDKATVATKTDNPFGRIDENTSEFEKLFDEMAEMVLNKYVLMVCGKQTRFREIEFYVNHPKHPDIYTHGDPDQKKMGCWYFHKTGKSYRGGTYKGLDIAIGGKDHHGGILIRSLQDKESGNVIEGSCMCVDHIIKVCKAAHPELDSIIKIVSHPSYRESVLDSEGLIHLEKLPDSAEKFKYYKGPRVGLGEKCPKYLEKLYRYVVLPAKVKKGKDTLALAMLKSGMDKREVQSLTGSTLATIDKLYYSLSKPVSKSTKK